MKISFTIEDQGKIAEIFELLLKHGAKDFRSSESLTSYILDNVQKSIVQSDKREVVESILVHAKARALCTK